MNIITKNCTIHGETEFNEFSGARKSGKVYTYAQCRLCASIRAKANREKHPGRSTEYSRKSRATPEGKLKLQAYVDKNRTKINERRKKEYAERRLMVLNHYAKDSILGCECCKETHLQFLALDHKFGGGNEHRRELGNSRLIHEWAIKNNYPPIFRVLCHNCNFAEAHGGCPHKTQGTS